MMVQRVLTIQPPTTTQPQLLVLLQMELEFSMF